MKQAVAWYRKPAQGMAQAVRSMTAAADGDEFLGTSRLGVMYFKGDGVPRGHDRAHALFDKAGATGQPAAKHWLGLIHEGGLGRASDHAKARALYALAPDLVQANVRLPVMQAEGKGGPRDMAYFRDLLEKWTREGETEWLEQLASAFDDATLAQLARARLRQLGNGG